jgi:crotonobetaine/carnitine-CoA ligase
VNLAQMLLGQRERHPALTLGVVGDAVSLEVAVDHGQRTARALLDSGLEAGDRLAVVEHTSTNYLIFWMACQFAGLSPALVNPGYPAELLAEMVSGFEPAAVVSAAGAETYGLAVPAIGIAGLRDGHVSLSGRSVALPATRGDDLPGTERDELSCAGFMHTSGTTGAPKFCSQSHRYFLRLGRYVADVLELTPEDHIFAPLPMFHINPLGYGFMGAMVAGAHLSTVEKFRPQQFWEQVKATEATGLILHAPPVQVIMQRTTAADAVGHRVRTMFYADGQFLDRFEIPFAAAGYGSTEAGGLTHVRRWNRGETIPPESREGMSHFVGTPRPDVDWMLTEDGEIRVRGREPGVLFDGYWRDGGLVDPLDPDGWFSTGDIGRRVGDELVFGQRRSESIRVRGEFVPIQYVEQQIAVACPDVHVALWKVEDGQAADERAVLYVSGDSLPADQIRSVIATLPPFMRPVEAVRIEAMPVDGGAGKVRRRLLKAATVIESCEL